MTTSSSGPTDARVDLADGRQIPSLALGVWQIDNGDDCVNAVRWALELGYRHIDTAQDYHNEESVGVGLRESGVPRAEVFVTTKFFPGGADPVAELERSLDRLGLDYVDLYLVHWPQGGPTWAWPAMERARDLGLARSIGVSNFDVAELDEVVKAGTTPPAVNQIQLSPFEHRRALIDAARTHGIALEAYSPLGTGRHLSNKVVREVADRLGRTPAQVLLRWSIQNGFVVLPKSQHRDRIAENAAIFDFALSDEDLTALEALDWTKGTDKATEFKWW